MAIINGMNDNNLKQVTPPEGTPVICVDGVMFPVGYVTAPTGGNSPTTVSKAQLLCAALIY